jgi:anti-anti-sigma factor
LELRVSRTKQPRGLRLSGELDVSNARTLARALSTEVSEGGDVTVDLSGVAFLDSTGLEALIRAARDLQGRGRLILVSPQQSVRKIFEIVLLDQRANVEIRDGLT